ncbi:hypothetical protein [Nioella halotolerans]|uniref:hypothetical protein n=1 Tax=Nioella halotolerans TaxID=2303578 RepID=UPI003F659745
MTDMCELGKPPRCKNAATLTTLKRVLGKKKIGHLDRQKLIDYGHIVETGLAEQARPRASSTSCRGSPP